MIDYYGNWIQALGGVTALGNELEDISDKNAIYNIIGNLLQVIGNSLQALSGSYELKASYNKVEKSNQDENDESLDVIGSWIQAIGSVISLIGQIHEESEEQNNGDEKNQTSKNY